MGIRINLQTVGLTAPHQIMAWHIGYNDDMLSNNIIQPAYIGIQAWLVLTRSIVTIFGHSLVDKSKHATLALVYKNLSLKQF